MSNKQALNILIVDDNRSGADALARVLTSTGDRVETSYDGELAIQKLRSKQFDVVLTDLKMEPVDGLTVLRAARSQRPPAEVVVFTAYGAVDIAVEAMRLGARDFLTKPVTVDQIAHRLDALRDDGKDLHPRVQNAMEFVAESAAAKQFVRQLDRCTASRAPIWIEGELGTGRVFAARYIHARSNQSKPSLFRVRPVGRETEWPEAGTVVLPNVDALPDDLQRVLLRDLAFLPKGLRVITTASPGARTKVQDNSLLADLYYALAVVVVQVPPLRERQEDVLPLFIQALETRSAQYERPMPELSEQQITLLKQHSWPGNIREVNNLAERAIIMGSNTLTFAPRVNRTHDVPELVPGFSLSNHLEQIERRILIDALRQAQGDRTVVGRLLGVERNTLRYKLNKYGLLN